MKKSYVLVLSMMICLFASGIYGNEGNQSKDSAYQANLTTKNRSSNWFKNFFLSKPFDLSKLLSSPVINSKTGLTKPLSMMTNPEQILPYSEEDDDFTFSAPNVLSGNGKIAFVSRRDGNNEIYIMDANGSNQIRLTNNTIDDLAPSFSPDGSKIVFTSLRDGNAEIYVMDSNGANQTRLTNNTDYDTVAKFSPDGSKIVFSSNRDGIGGEVYIMNDDGTDQTRLTLNSIYNDFPSFSPDGSKIVFTSGRDGNGGEIYIINVDGTGEVRLTNNSASDEMASFSPDGSKLTFFSDRDGNAEIYVMDSNGLNQVRLTNNTANDFYSTYSPDGTKILFSSFRDGSNNQEIYVMDVNGENQTRLTNIAGHDYSPAWQPVGISTYTISGTVTSSNGTGANLLVTLTGTGISDSTTTMTDVSGNYSFPNLTAGGDYGVILDPTVFLSPSQVVNNLQSNQTVDFSGMRMTYTISGTVTRNTNPVSGVPNMNIQLQSTTNATFTNTTTDQNGNYNFTDIQAGYAYRIMPSPAGYSSITPASRDIAYLNAGVGGQDFTATVSTYTISGQITRGGSPLSNVAVNLSGSSTGSTTTNGSGNYSFTVAEGGNYTVTPSLANNVFTPTNRTFNAVSSNQTGNFTAQLVTYTITGNVKADGANLAGATVSLTGGQQSSSTQTDANGNYTLTVALGGSYTVSVYKNGFNFDPASQTFTNVQTNQTANFQSGVPLCVPPSSGLLAWFKGEGNANDSTGNGFNGALQNGATTVAGKVGQAFSFNGVNNFVQAGNQSGLKMTNQLSLSAWIYPTGAGGGVNNDGGAIINKEGEYAIGRFPDGKIYWTLANANPGWVTQNTNYVAPLNQWTNLTFVYNGTTAKLYANGTEVYSATATGTIGDAHPSQNELFIGGRQLYTHHFQGLIDEAQIYNRALSASEVAAINTAGSAGVCLGVYPTELITNGSFETGNFNGWTVSSMANPYCTAWAVVISGGSCHGSTFSPQHGNYVAVNGFDGAGPGQFTMHQDVTIPQNNLAQLTWKDRINWNMTNTTSQPRIYQVQVRNTSNVILETIYAFTANPQATASTGWLTHSANLSAYAGQTVRIYFYENIPQTYTGPGQFEIDAISLMSSSQNLNFTPSASNVSISPANNLRLDFSNVTTSGNTVAVPLTASQIPALPLGYSLLPNSPKYDIRTSAGYTGNITVTFDVPNVADMQTCSRLRSLHFENGQWTTDTNGSPSYNGNTMVCTVSQTVTSLSPFVVTQISGTTAAAVSVAGRVLTAEGRGMAKARVAFTDAQGNIRGAITNQFGYYSFENVEVGQTYVFNIKAKGRQFAPQIVPVNDAIRNLNFIALE